jgi:hypothetical protein
MARGTSSYNGLAVGLYGEHQLTQVDSAIDCFTITGASTAGVGTLLTIENSAGTPAVNGVRVYDYGRTRIIRTDDSAHGSAFKNALDVKYDVNVATGASQIYAASIILDIAGGSQAGGRQAVLQLQHYGNSGSHSGISSCWLLLTDLSAAETSEMGCFVHFQGQTIAAGNMLRPISNPDSGFGLVMYWDNTMYFIMVADNSG